MTDEALEWVTNEPAALRWAMLSEGQSLENYKAWRAQFVEGEPKGKDAHSAKRLREMGMVGLYRRAKA